MEHNLRTGEVSVAPPPATDAGLVFIGRIGTPWTERSACPRQGALDGPLCTIEVFEPWIAALDGVAQYPTLEILYWMNQSRRDLVRQNPANDHRIRGTFALRSPIRPNPIASSIVALERLEGGMLFVRGLDCLDGTPLLDIKPDRRCFSPPNAAPGEVTCQS